MSGAAASLLPEPPVKPDTPLEVALPVATVVVTVRFCKTVVVVLAVVCPTAQPPLATA